LALVKVKDGEPHSIDCKTKRLELGDDTDSASVKGLLQTIRSFSHEHHVEAFVIKARMKSGQMASGAVSFKIETLFQLSDTPIIFVTAKSLAGFAVTNLGGVPGSLKKYQEDAFRCGALHLKNLKLI